MDTVEFMQKKIKEAHQIMKRVKEYMDEHTLKNHEGLTIDYNDPDQEFFIRLITEFDHLSSMLDMFMEYIVKPVRKEGELAFDYSTGVFKLGDEVIQPGNPIEYMENGWWNVGVLEKDPVKPMTFYMGDVRANRKDMELKGLKVRVR